MEYRVLHRYHGQGNGVYSIGNIQGMFPNEQCTKAITMTTIKDNDAEEGYCSRQTALEQRFFFKFVYESNLFLIETRERVDKVKPFGSFELELHAYILLHRCTTQGKH